MAAPSDLSARRARRLKRLPLVLALALGLLVSLIHCCGDAVAAPHDAGVTLTWDAATPSDPSDASDQQLPAHAGHCLSHVRAESAFTVMPPDIMPRMVISGNERRPLLAAALPPFKPPRI